jgi:hypothetical protein
MNSNNARALEQAAAQDSREKVWIQPYASKASRRPALKSTTSVRGALVNPATNREIVYESTLERDLACILLADPSVEDIHDQPEPVSYIDSNGVVREHTFDFVAHRTDGTRTAVAVKPATKVVSSGIAETLNLIRAQCPPSFADHFAVRTGDHITRDRAADARLILKSRRMCNDGAIAEVKAIASTLRGAVKISDLLTVSRNDGHGFMAVVRLIGDGVLEHVGPGRISYDSAVRPAREFTPNH